MRRGAVHQKAEHLRCAVSVAKDAAVQTHFSDIVKQSTNHKFKHLKCVFCVARDASVQKHFGDIVKQSTTAGRKLASESSGKPGWSKLFLYCRQTQEGSLRTSHLLKRILSQQMRISATTKLA